MKQMLPSGVLLRALCLSLLLALLGCGSQPPTPDWQMNAHSAAQSAVRAYFEGNQRVEQSEFARARTELSRTGDVPQLARLELLRCAAQLASLVTGPCSAFDALASDATAHQQAYARYIAGRAGAADIDLLPTAQRGPAAAAPLQLAAAIDAQKEPLARLVAAGAAFVRGDASPQVVQLAVDTASRQGWRRPLLAWLGVQIELAERAGQNQELIRLRRRVAIVAQGGKLE